MKEKSTEFGDWSLSEIIEGQYFRVPDYQRGYAWGERQLAEFWEDLGSVVSSGARHYTGAITVEALGGASEITPRKGFAVVAHEVGNLAGHSQTAVTEAEQSNQMVFGDINTVNTILKTVTEKMDEIRHMMTRVSENITTTLEKGNDINNSMGKVADIINRVEGLVSKVESLLD